MSEYEHREPTEVPPPAPAADGAEEQAVAPHDTGSAAEDARAGSAAEDARADWADKEAAVAQTLDAENESDAAEAELGADGAGQDGLPDVERFDTYPHRLS